MQYAHRNFAFLGSQRGSRRVCLVLYSNLSCGQDRKNIEKRKDGVRGVDLESSGSAKSGDRSSPSAIAAQM